MNADRPIRNAAVATNVRSLTAAAQAIAEGSLTARDLAEAQLARVEATDAASTPGRISIRRTFAPKPIGVMPRAPWPADPCTASASE
jgi:hypothetical protein